MKLRHILLAIAPLSLFLAFAPKAHADLIFNLGGEADDDGCTGTCQGGTSTVFGTIDLHQVDMTHVLVTETLNNTGVCTGGQTCFIQTGHHDALTFNITGAPAINITGLTTGFSVDTSPSNPVPEGGTWDYGVLCTGCGPGSSAPLPGPLSFTVALTGGGNLSINDFSHQPGSDDFFASDILSSVTGNTGAVAADAGHATVPEPRTTAVMLLGGLAMAFVLRRKKAASE